ncbi:Protein FAM35A [Trichoplax sp. H2]|nr:Protein FAM35A [Trichoplax sp. H2]|eukprot:RDD45147.1 Protein FAM35A [Trichoplax sp. H2]
MEEIPTILIFCNPPSINNKHLSHQTDHQSKKRKLNPASIQWKRKLYRHPCKPMQPSTSACQHDDKDRSSNNSGPSTFEYINTVIDHGSNLQKEFDRLMRDSQAIMPGISSQSGFQDTDQILCSDSNSHDFDYHTSWNDSLPIDNFNSIPDSCEIEEFTSSTYSSCDSVKTCDSISSDDHCNENQLLANKTENPIASDQAAETSSDKLHQPTRNQDSQELLPNFKYMLYGITIRISKIANCTQKSQLVNLLVVALQVNPAHEIQTKSGKNAGQMILIGSMLVGDPTQSYFKITLWRQNTAWLERISLGDILLLADLEVDEWRGKYFAQSIHSSWVVNLHKCRDITGKRVRHYIPSKTMDDVYTWASNYLPHIYNTNDQSTLQVQSKGEVQFVTYKSLTQDVVVHFKAKLLSIKCYTIGNVTYQYETKRLPKMVATLAESSVQRIKLQLWGRQARWFSELRANINRVWKWSFLHVHYDEVTDNYVLNTTPISEKSLLDDKSSEAVDINRKCDNYGLELQSIKQMLSISLQSVIILSANIKLLRFQNKSGRYRNISLETKASYEDLSKQMTNFTYVGCSLCSKMLPQDKNEVYKQCAQCIREEQAFIPATITRCYRPITIVLTDGQQDVSLTASNEAIVKLFLNVPANSLTKRLHPESNITYAEVIADLCRHMVKSCNSMKFRINCTVTQDDNGFIVSRRYELHDVISH